MHCTLAPRLTALPLESGPLCLLLAFQVSCHIQTQDLVYDKFPIVPIGFVPQKSVNLTAKLDWLLSYPNSRAHLGSHSLTPHSIKTSQQRPEFHCRTWLRGSRWLDWLLSPSSLSALPLCFLSGGGPQVFDDDDDHELSSLLWFWSDSVQQVLMMKMNGTKSYSSNSDS